MLISCLLKLQNYYKFLKLHEFKVKIHVKCNYNNLIIIDVNIQY